MNKQQNDKTRLDKWLWAARFFKTRLMASQAVSGGKVHLDGQRLKPSRAVKTDDIFEIRRGFERLQVVVTELSIVRGSAAIAAGLYRETDESIARREKESEQRKLAALQNPQKSERPNKKQRRQIHRFTSKI